MTARPSRASADLQCLVHLASQLSLKPADSVSCSTEVIQDFLKSNGDNPNPMIGSNGEMGELGRHLTRRPTPVSGLVRRYDQPFCPSDERTGFVILYRCIQA